MGIARIVDKCGKRGTSQVDLPENFHTLDEEQLSAVCAAHGLKDLSGREERLDALEELRLIAPSGAVAALKGKAKVAAIKDKGKPKALAIMDKKYLKQQGKKVVSQSSTAESKAKAKAKATQPANKRRKVMSDE